MFRGKAIVCGLLIAVVGVTGAPGKTTTKSKTTSRTSVRPVQVYTLKGCSRCASLKRYLRAKGVDLDITNIDQRYFELYPTVYYSDNYADYGQRIFSGRCRYPSSLEVIETE